MQRFDHDGLGIAYIDEGEGEPILLIHGFGSSHQVNWVDTGWVDLLKRNGRRVIALDNRGHGRSSKPYEPEAYHPSRMAGDGRVTVSEHISMMGSLGIGRLSAL